MIYRQNQKGRRGGVLVMFALAMVVIIGGSGLAVDIGRMYVNRTEAQSFVDSLALARAAEMIGARTVNNADIWKQYDFNNQSFDGADVVVDYSSGPGFASGTVTSSPGAGSLYVRARATVDVPLVLLPVILGQNIGTVSAVAVAGLELLTSTGEGSFPYVVRNPNPTGGLDEGTAYTFRWGNNPAQDLNRAWNFVQSNIDAAADLNARLAATAAVLRGQSPFAANPPNINQWCPGHATGAYLATLYAIDPFEDGVSSGLFQWTGSFFQGGTRDIVDAMAFGYQDQVVTIGDSISVATGVRQATVQELRDIINADTNTTDNDFGTYDDSGNGMRVIFVPVVDGNTAFLQPGSGATATVIGFETFLLMAPADTYYPNAGGPGVHWCAVYVGPAEFGTETPVNQNSGVWILRLVS